MPLGSVRLLGGAPNHDEWGYRFLWAGEFSTSHADGDIITYIKSYIRDKHPLISLLLMQCDGVETTNDERALLRSFIYNPTMFEEHVPRDTDTALIVTLATRKVMDSRILHIPLDDESFRLGVYERLSGHIARTPWEEKIPTVFWRGSLTGEIGENSRTRCVKLLCDSPHADVRLTPMSWNNFATGEFADKTNTRYYAERRPTQDFVRHKYNLIIDGSCIASSLQWTFASGSVPILVTHPGNNWWFKRYLEPMKHYVPVAYDVSDLEERLEWLVTHDEEARAIAENAVAFSQYYLSAEFQQYHLRCEIDALLGGV